MGTKEGNGLSRKRIVRGIKKPVVFGLILLMILGAFFSFSFVPPAKKAHAAGTTYYVDSVGGLDSNTGTDSSHPWQTVAKVNSSSFTHGDSILFKRGDVWREELTVPSSGINGDPIIFGAYGTGDNPKLNGSALIDNASFSPYSINQPLLYSVTPGNDQHDGVTRNYREVITPSTGSNNNNIKLKFTASASANWVIAGVSIGAQSSGNAATSLTRATFGGSNGVTINAGTTATSDSINFPVTAGTSYLVHVYMTARNMKYNASGTTYYDANAGDETLITSPSGSQLNSSGAYGIVTAIIGDFSQTIWSSASLPSYSISSLTSSGTTATATTPSAHELSAIGSQYITVSGASPAGYNGTVAVTVTDATHFTYTISAGLSSPATGTITYTRVGPLLMWENNVFLNEQSSIVACGVPGSWYWDGTTLYVNGYNQDNPATNGKTYEVGHLAYGIFDNQKNYLEIKNIDTTESYGGSDSTGNVSTGSGMSGIVLEGSYSVVHDLVSYHNARHEFAFYSGSTNNLAYNLTLHDDLTTTPVSIFGTGTANNTLQNSTIYSTEAACASGLYSNGLLIFHGTAHGNTVQNNDFNVSGTNPSMIINTYDAGSDSNVFRYNYIHGTFQRAFKLNGVNSDSIYGNIIAAQSAIINPTFDIISASGTTIYNNTIIGSSSQYGINLTTSPNTLVKNNIFYGPKAISVDAGSETGFVSDYNLFYNASGSSWVWGATTYATLADWRTNSSQDAHSLNADPVFVNPASDFHLQSTSPAIDAGVDLNIATDYAGKQRYDDPAVANTGSVGSYTKNYVDIGAYEYVTPPVPGLSSPTHPSQVAWYQSATPQMTVNPTSSTTTYKYSVDQTLAPTLASVLAGTASATATFTAAGLITSDGTWYVHVAALNLDGDSSTTYATYTINYDGTPPTTSTSINPLNPDGSNGWYVTDPSITLLATDLVSGVNAILFHWDANADSTYSAAFNAPEGTHTLYYHATDNAGNSSVVGQSAIKLDTTPPVAFTPTVATSSWTNALVMPVNFSTTDASSGVASYSVKVDSGAYINNVTSPYNLDISTVADGAHTVTVKAIDNAGNYREALAGTIQLDKTPPTVGIAVTPANPDGSNGYYKTLPTITLSATDGSSGVLATYFHFDSGADMIYSSSFNPPQGHHVLSYYAVDNAGNSSAVFTRGFYVDTSTVTTTSSTPTSSASPKAISNNQTYPSQPDPFALTLDE